MIHIIHDYPILSIKISYLHTLKNLPVGPVGPVAMDFSTKMALAPCTKRRT